MADEDLDPTIDDTGDSSGALGAIANQLQDLVDPSTTPEAQEYARRILGRAMTDPYAKTQSQLYSDLEKNTQEAQAALRAAREKLMARRYNPADAWFALAGALGSPTATGQMAETLGKAATALRDPTQKRFEWEQARDKEALGLQEQESNLQDRLLALKLGQLGATRKSDVELEKEALKTLGKRTSQAGNVQSKAIQAMDRAYSKEYVDWIQNGEPEASQAIGELNQAFKNLQKSDNLTGPVVGSISTIPLVGKPIQDIFFPKSANTQEMVESTVQRSLRPILGAQFTEKEGERLISRVYNPRLEESVNAQRLQRLIAKLNDAYKNKQEAATWFRKNGTLAGFKPKHSFTVDDFMPDTTWPGESKDEETPDEQDSIPAAGISPSQLPPGTKIYKKSDLPHKRGFAEGGHVKIPEGKIPVQLDDGSIIWADKNATQEDIDALTATPAATPAATPPSQPSAAPAGAQPAPGEPGTDDRTLARALFGAGIGAAGGYPAARTGLRALTSMADLLPGRRELPAESRLLRLMEKQGMTPADLAAAARRSQRQGVPVTAMDVGPPAFRSLAETALPQGGEQTQDLLDRLTTRQNAARDRAMEQVNQALKPDPYFDKEKELIKRVYGEKNAPSVSSQMYDAAKAQFPSVNSQQLFQLMDTPAGKQAVKQAVKEIRNKPGVSIGKTDAMGMVTKPSLEFLQVVKERLDDMITKEEGSGANYAPTSHGRNLRQLRDSFVSEIDRATTDPRTGESPYAAARQQYETDKGMLDALREGRADFRKLQPEQLAKRVGQMSFEQKDAFRTGVAQHLYEMLEKPDTDINAARKLVGSPAMQKKLSTLFDNPNEFKVFNEALNKEMEIFEKSKPLMAQEPVIGRRAVAPQGNVIQRGAQKAPTLGIFNPMMWALRWIRAKPELKDDEAKQIIEMMKSQTPEELRAFEQRLGPKFGREAARKGMRGKVGMLGAGIGAVAGALEGAMQGKAGASEPPPEEEEDPALQGLSEEEKKWAKTPAKKKGGRVKFADGGRVGTLMALIEKLKQEHSQTPLVSDALRARTSEIAQQTGTSPGLVWNLFQRQAELPESRGVERPMLTDQLDSLKQAIAAERQRMAEINNQLLNAKDQATMSPAQAESLHQNQMVASAVLDRATNEPTYDNYYRLQQLVRALAQSAGMKRGGRAYGR